MWTPGIWYLEVFRDKDRLCRRYRYVRSSLFSFLLTMRTNKSPQWLKVCVSKMNRNGVKIRVWNRTICKLLQIPLSPDCKLIVSRYDLIIKSKVMLLVFPLCVWLSKGLIIKPKNSIIKINQYPRKAWHVSVVVSRYVCSSYICHHIGLHHHSNSGIYGIIQVTRPCTFTCTGGRTSPPKPDNQRMFPPYYLD